MLRVFVVAILALLTLTSCETPSGGPSPTPSPANSDAPSPEPSTPPIDYSKLSEPKLIGTGHLEGVSPDGSAVYVADTDPQLSQPGCEGQPEPVLFRLPVDGGPRTLLGGDAAPVRGFLVNGPETRVAIVDLCEGFFVSLHVAHETPGGQLTDFEEVKPKLQNQGLVAGFSFSFTPDGRYILAAVNDVNASDSPSSEFLRIDPSTGEVTNLFTTEDDGVLQFSQLASGTYVVSSNREVTFHNREGETISTFPGTAFEVFPSRTRVAIYGEKLLVVTQEGESEVVVPQRPGYEISEAEVSPDGRAIVLSRYEVEDGAGRETLVVSIADGTITPVPGATSVEPGYFTGDGRAIVFNRFVEGGGFEVLLVETGTE